MDQKNTMHDILAQREDFLVIGLTGRLGSGCSKVAEVLATPFDKMQFPHPVPQRGQPSLTDESRTIRILAEYAEAHWLKFDIIQVGAIIATFILNDDSRFIKDLNKSKKTNISNTLRREFREGIFEDYYRNLFALGKSLKLVESDEKIEKYCQRIKDHGKQKKATSDQGMIQIGDNLFVQEFPKEKYNTKFYGRLNELGNLIKQQAPNDKKIKSLFPDGQNTKLRTQLLEQSEISRCNWGDIGTDMDYLYRQVLQKNPDVHRRKYLECIDEITDLLAFHCLFLLLNSFLRKKDAAADKLWDWLVEVNKCVDPNAKDDADILQINKYIFVKYITTWFGQTVRRIVKQSLGDDAYARLFQRYGQMIRFHSRILPPEITADYDEKTANYDGKKDIFAIPRKINQHIKVLRHPFNSKNHRPVRIVVDSIKNVFEAVYLRYRYSAFYLWAVTTDPVIREQRLYDKQFTNTQIRKLDWNEYPDIGSNVIQKVNKIKNDLFPDQKPIPERQEVRNKLAEKLQDGVEEVDFFFDCLENKPLNEDDEEFDETRQEFFLNGTYVFYTQDVDSCVCNADVYLFNNADGSMDSESNCKLLETVVRNVSLSMYPGLVRPTPVERCMQIALGAKVNSGCLSRQVGAVVTDSQYNILAIGWNDVPCGEVPCAYKNLNDIAASADPDAYSEYELKNTDFRKRIANHNVDSSRLRGLPLSYCFKDIHKDGKDPMRSRAMHAEEKALALCGREAEGGFLFTTSSPCEMCSKNAKNHKIKKIYYIEAYPGISQAQYTNSGDKNNRAELILFSGAVGRAYMQMYTPLLPHKDVLGYLGIDKSKQYYS